MGKRSKVLDVYVGHFRQKMSNFAFVSFCFKRLKLKIVLMLKLQFEIGAY